MTIKLDPHQEAAVDVAGHCLISAGPGSGKTRVITERAARLLASHPSHKLAAVTFTRDAAKEIKERILERSGKEAAKRVAVGSFHSLCLAQMKSGQIRLGRLVSEGERYGLIRRAMQSINFEGNMEDAIKDIDRNKSTVVPENPAPPVYMAYERILREESAMDFQDILLKSVHLMREKALKPLPVRWMLVDEFQDTDEIQYAWVKHHAEAGIEVTVVGDDDQSLYSWRNALGYDGMMRFAKEHNAVSMVLPINYRCAPNILQSADRLIQFNDKRVDKKLQAFKTDEGNIQIVRAADRKDEVRSISDRLSMERDQEWAVLCRSNRILDEIELELTRKQIPYQRIGGGSFWSRAEPAVLVGMLQSLLDGKLLGITSALHYAGVPQDALEGFYAQSLSDIPSALTRHAASLEKDGETAPWLKTMSKMGELWAEWSSMCNSGEINRVISATAVWLSSLAAEDKKHYFLWSAQSLTKVPGNTLQQRLMVIRQKKDDSFAHNVTLMTLHASKGLEFDNVWIMAVEENTLPHTDGDKAEERRLMYVGMTRARKNLYISHTLTKTTPSRFLVEAGL